MKHKKHLIIGVLAAAMLVLSTVAVLAQNQPIPQPVPQTPNIDGEAMRGGPGGMWGRQHGAGMMSSFSLLEVVAQELGISVEEVWDQLDAGVSIAELAASYDIDIQIIIDAALSQHQAALDDAAAAGWLSAEQAAWMQENMASMLVWRVNQPWGTRPGYGDNSGNNYGPSGCRGRQSVPPAVMPQGDDT